MSQNHYQAGVTAGRAAEEHGTPYDPDLFLDADYRRGLRDGRTAYIDEKLADQVWGADALTKLDPAVYFPPR